MLHVHFCPHSCKTQAYKEREEDKPYVECEEDAAEDEREKVEAGTFQASRTYSSLNVAWDLERWMWRGLMREMFMGDTKKQTPNKKGKKG